MRALAAITSLALVGATAWPLVHDPRDDGFPLSTYPMFATRRGAVQTYRYALGETVGGARRTLRPDLLGTGEVLQALRVVDRAFSGGHDELARLCDRIAARAAADRDFRDVVAIRIVSGTHDAVEYLARGRVGREVEHLRCRVKR